MKLQNVVHVPLFATVLAGALSSQAGLLDAGFGSNGLFLPPPLDPAHPFDAVRAVAVQSDNKIVAAGFMRDPANAFYWAVLRFLPDGTPDSSFGPLHDGRFLLPSNLPANHDVTIDAQGRIVVAGQLHGDFGVLRLLPNGTPDTAFGANGVVQTDVANSNDFAVGVAVQSDQKIVVGGTAVKPSGQDVLAIVRYNANGTLDTTFGTKGKVTTSLIKGAQDSEGIIRHGLVIQTTDQKIVICANVFAGSTSSSRLLRFLPSGKIDSAFGNSGVATVAFPYSSEVMGLGVQSNGRIVVSAGALINGTPNVAVARYLPSGGIDTSFGGAGGYVYASTTGYPSRLAIQADDKIVVGAIQDSGQYQRLFVFRFLASGGWDSGFGLDGMSQMPDPGPDLAAGYNMMVAVGPDGRIVVGTAFPLFINGHLDVSREQMGLAKWLGN